MDITTLGFLQFIGVGLLVYYLLPQKCKWMVLLVMSFIFYSFVDVRNVFFILAFTTSSYCFGRAIEKVSLLKSVKKIDKMGGGCPKRNGSPFSAKFFVICAIVVDILILVLIKFLPASLNQKVVLYSRYKLFKFFMPIGISYYTLMSISYVLDVYWEKNKAEHNYFRLMLFTGYFPLLVQGPISKWGQLSEEFFKEHKYDFKNIKYGIELMIWGFFKKLVVADRAGVYVNNVFGGNELPQGFNVLVGLILYGIQLYFDFSGGIDVIRGVSECFDVKLIENFKQPYFSNSLGEFWRRWHISLGDWMKDYIFYPFTMSKTCRNIKKALKKIHVSSKVATQISFAIADLLVFFLVGIWHGTGSKFLAWGMYNGLILAFSVLAAPLYERTKKTLHINDKCKGWLYFCIFRTLVIVTIGWVFDCGATASEGIKLFVNLFRFTGENIVGLGKFQASIILFGCILQLIVSIIHEKGISVREKLSNKPFCLQLIVWTVLFQFILYFAATSRAGGFMYAQF